MGEIGAATSLSPATRMIEPAARPRWTHHASAKVAALLDERFGRLDILINNATTLGRYDEMASTADLAEVRTNFETTLFCAWAVAQTFLPLLLKSPRGCLVNVSSGASSHVDREFGLPTAAAMPVSYAVAKAALNALAAKACQGESGPAYQCGLSRLHGDF